MNLDTIRQALVGHLTGNFSTAPLALPNLDFTPPAGPWVRVELDLGETFGREFGPGGVSFRKGELRLLVYDLTNNGLQDILEIAQALETLFRLADLPDAYGVLCGDPWTGPPENEDEDAEITGYEVQVVHVPWQALVEL